MGLGYTVVCYIGLLVEVQILGRCGDRQPGILVGGQVVRRRDDDPTKQ